MNPTVVTTVVGGVLVAGAVLVWNYVPQQRRLARFHNRAELSPDAIYSQFFATKNLPKEFVCELWNEVAALLRVPPGKLRPSDRFHKELAPVEGWEFDDDIGEVYWAAERRLKKLGLKIEHSNVHTLGDYVEFFCKLQPAKSAL
jgi:hypothetical protein